jgi:hypothetical protein
MPPPCITRSRPQHWLTYRRQEKFSAGQSKAQTAQEQWGSYKNNKMNFLPAFAGIIFSAV